MAEYGQGMVRPGAWSLGGTLVRSSEVPALVATPASPKITDPCDERYIPEIWSRRAIEAREQQLQWQRLTAATGTYAPVAVLYSTSGSPLTPSWGVSTQGASCVSWGTSTHAGMWVAPLRQTAPFCQLCTREGVHIHSVPNTGRPGKW